MGQQTSQASSGIHTANQRNLLYFGVFLRHWNSCVPNFIQEQTTLYEHKQVLLLKIVIL